MRISLVGVLALAPIALAHSCVDNSGSPVAWWFTYKMPDAGNDPNALNGYAYAYSDANTPSLVFQTSKTLNSSDSALEATLKSGYANGDAYMYYNDDHPDDESAPSSRAHAKGVVTVSSDKTGFWLIHSTPRYPFRGETSFPLMAHTYGQTFLCISVTNATEWSDIGKQLQIDNVSVYDQSLPSWFLSMAPAFGTIQDGPIPSGIPTYRLVKVGNGEFLSFAKSRAWNNDLYGALVAPTLQCSLLAETWMRPRLASRCGVQYDVMNVQTMQIGPVEFRETQDHSKLAIGGPGCSTPYVCVGDINRMTSQRKRGGGTVCFVQPDLWKSLSKAILTYEACT